MFRQDLLKFGGLSGHVWFPDFFIDMKEDGEKRGKKEVCTHEKE